MNFKLGLFFSFVICVVNCKNFKASDIYKRLDSREKIDFLRYHLAKGYVISEKIDGLVINFPDDLNIPLDFLERILSFHLSSEFAIEFFYDTRNRFHLTSMQILSLVRGEEVCLPDGTCVDTGDSGTVCCS